MQLRPNRPASEHRTHAAALPLMAAQTQLGQKWQSAMESEEQERHWLVDEDIICYPVVQFDVELRVQTPLRY